MYIYMHVCIYIYISYQKQIFESASNVRHSGISVFMLKIKQITA